MTEEEAWDRMKEAARPAIQLVIDWMKQNPKTVRRIRKLGARDRKRQRIERRQVARAIVIVNQAPPIIHKGKAPRC